MISFQRVGWSQNQCAETTWCSGSSPRLVSGMVGVMVMAGMSSTEVSLETESSTHHRAHFLRMKMLNWWGRNQTCKNKETPTLKPVSEGAKTTEV